MCHVHVVSPHMRGSGSNTAIFIYFSTSWLKLSPLADPQVDPIIELRIVYLRQTQPTICHGRPSCFTRLPSFPYVRTASEAVVSRPAQQPRAALPAGRAVAPRW